VRGAPPARPADGSSAPGAGSLFGDSPPPRVAYVLGNETTGISPSVAEQLTGCLGIPMAGNVESLNVASGAAVVFVTHDLEEAIALADRVCVITAGPGTVKGTYTIDLPRPRNIAEIRFDPRFVYLYQRIWEDLRDEVVIAYERSKHRAAG